MDQMKTGHFIAECRKARGLTQAQLAEKLGITDRAVSKWETGRSMPDSGLMLELCDILGITVNDLLSGEKIAMTNYNQIAEENLLAMKREVEERNRFLLKMEWVIGLSCTVSYLALFFTACYLVHEQPWQALLIALSMVVLLTGCVFALQIERDVGWYVCRQCGHHFIPGTGQVWMAMHFGRTRYMKCPECGKWSWCRKTVSKD